MKTVDKALSVLDQFSHQQTEIGLSALARMADLDKAATRRILLALMKHGFIEQLPETKKYRLGAGFLRVANWLVEQTNETAHVSLPGPHGMTTIAHQIPKRGRVITIDPAELLPYHATSSGLCYLAFCTPQTASRLLALPRHKIIDETMTDQDELHAALVKFRAQGYATTRNSFEADVASIGMPFYQDDNDPTGSIALALPKADMTAERRTALVPILRDAVARLETALTGR